MSQEKAHIAQNAIIQIGGKIASTIAGLATFALLWRLLTPDVFGQYTLAITFLGIFATVVDFGLTLTTVQLISEHGDRQNEIFGNLLSLRLISAGVFLGLAPVIALFFPYAWVVKIAIAIGVLSFYSQSIYSMLIGVFQKRLVMIQPVIAEILNRLVVLCGVGALFFTGASLFAIMGVFVLGNISQLLLTLYFTSRYLPLRPRLSLTVWKEIISRSWPIGISIFFNLLYLKGDIIFLSFFRSEAEVGLYGTAYKIIEVIAALPVMYMGLILPILVSAHATGNQNKFRLTMQDAFDFFTTLVWPIAAGAAITGVALISLIASPKFAPAGTILYILGPAMLGVWYGALFGHAVVGVKKQKSMTWAYVAISAITLAGYALTIPKYGVYAAASWTFISEGLLSITAAFVVIKASGLRLKLGQLWRVILSTVIMSLVLLAIPANISVVLRVIAGIISYSLTLWVFGGLSYKNFRSMLRGAENLEVPAV